MSIHSVPWSASEVACAKWYWRMRELLRTRGYSPRTEEAYLAWARRFVRFHRVADPERLHADAVREFVESLGGRGRRAPSTQNQALAALAFLQREVLRRQLPARAGLRRPKLPRRVPDVLSPADLDLLFGALRAPFVVLVGLLYGAGLRVQEAAALRVRDLDGSFRSLRLRGRGSGAREVPIPARLVESLRAQLRHARAVYELDCRDGAAGVTRPDDVPLHGFDGRLWRWFWVFPATSRLAHPRSGREHRPHIALTALQSAVRHAAREARIAIPVTCHTLRASYAVHLLERGTNVRVVQQLLGHRSVSSTLRYQRVARLGGPVARSPLDYLPRGPGG